MQGGSVIRFSWARACITVEPSAIPIFGTMVSVELIARILGTNSATMACNACLIGGIYFAVGVVPVFLGVLGPGLMPELGEPEQLIPSLAEKYLPTVLYVVCAGAVISAILSTVAGAARGRLHHLAPPAGADAAGHVGD